MSSKAALKAVRTALDSKDFQDAADKANDLVKRDPKNYHAYDPPHLAWNLTDWLCFPP
jgi:superkiller protein 3